MNRLANADASMNARQPESLNSLIEELGNELDILNKHLSTAVDLADRLHGKPPASSQGLTPVPPEPFGLLDQLRKRCDALNVLNSGIGHELVRISNAL